MLFGSNIVILSLIFGMDSFIVNIWRLICWIFFYIMLQIFSIRELQSSNLLPAMSIMKTIKFNWLFTNVSDLSSKLILNENLCKKRKNKAICCSERSTEHSTEHSIKSNDQRFQANDNFNDSNLETDTSQSLLQH